MSKNKFVIHPLTNMLVPSGDGRIPIYPIGDNRDVSKMTLIGEHEERPMNIYSHEYYLYVAFGIKNISDSLNFIDKIASDGNLLYTKYVEYFIKTKLIKYTDENVIALVHSTIKYNSQVGKEVDEKNIKKKIEEYFKIKSTNNVI
jgi:hypothetical protein